MGILNVCMSSQFLCIITRFSRKIIWLKVASTNHDPKVVLQYYLESVEVIQGIAVHVNQ